MLLSERTRRHLVSRVLRLLVIVILAAAAGFAWFVHASLQPGAPPPEDAGGIVVLTGGADRVETGLRLLAQGRGRLLLISGVAPHAELSELSWPPGLDPRAYAGRITLGRTATSTAGNATETAAWARAHDLHRLIVVTAGYHMPRALTELRRTLPGVTFYPAPVLPHGLRQGLDLAVLRLLAEEYLKWLGSLAGLSGFLHLHAQG